MANALTGDYDALAEIRVEAVNRILATLHQNAGSHDDALSVPHSFAVRIGDASWVLTAAAAQLASQVLGAGARPGSGRPADSAPASPKAPPGAQHAFDQMMAEIHAAQAALTTPAPIRGTAQVQASTPTITVASGSTSEVTVHVRIRAHYKPDPDTQPLPAPIHGELRAAFSVEPNPWAGGGKTVLEVKPTGDDKKIQFLPASGTVLTGGDVTTLLAHIRPLLRQTFEPTNVELPTGFQFSRFKGLGTGNDRVLALPVTLSGAAPSDKALASVNTLFLKPGDHFGVAVSRQYVESVLQPMLGSLKAFKASFAVSFWVVYVLVPVKHTATYTVGISSVELGWSTGSLTLTVKGSAVTSSILPNYTFTVTQKLKLAFNPQTQTVSLQKDGALSLHLHTNSVVGVPDVVRDKARAAAETARDDALQQAQSQIQAALTGSVGVDDALKSFESSAGARYTSVEIVPDGVILRGTVSVKARPPFVLRFSQTPDGTALTALKSWVPGGTIERFQWSWEKPNPFFDVPQHHLEGATLAHVVSDEHAFLLPVPEEVPPDGRVCLQIQGTQIPSSPQPLLLSRWEGTCQVIWPQRVAIAPAIRWDGIAGSGRAPMELAAAVPVWLETRLTVPLWRRDASAPDAPLAESIAAHVSAVGPADPAGHVLPAANALVHFAAPESERPLAQLAEFLRHRPRGDAALAVIAVLPTGSFSERRAVLAERFGTFGVEAAASLAVTEDVDGAWTRAFGIGRAPSTCLVSPAGEVVWSQPGPLNVAAVAAALEQHAVARPSSRPRLARPGLAPGVEAPDFLFDYASGRRLALRKLRGRRVLLNFWQSWSAPCLAELTRLQGLHAAAAQGAPVVLAINDGEEPERIAHTREALGLTFTLVPDPHRQIARPYGIACWPTSVHVDEGGVVERVDLGAIAEDMRRADGDAVASVSLE